MHGEDTAVHNRRHGRAPDLGEQLRIFDVRAAVGVCVCDYLRRRGACFLQHALALPAEAVWSDDALEHRARLFACDGELLEHGLLRRGCR